MATDARLGGSYENSNGPYSNSTVCAQASHRAPIRSIHSFETSAPPSDFPFILCRHEAAAGAGTKYIGMDVHNKSISIAVRTSGCLLGSDSRRFFTESGEIVTGVRLGGLSFLVWFAATAAMPL